MAKGKQSGAEVKIKDILKVLKGEKIGDFNVLDGSNHVTGSIDEIIDLIPSRTTLKNAF